MHIDVCKLIGSLSLTLVALAGCDLKPEVVGATLPTAGPGEGSTGGGSTGEASTGGDGAPTTGLAGDGDACVLAGGDVEEDPPGCTGEGCGAEPEYGGGPIVTADLACAGGRCLYAANVETRACEVDGDCADDERFAGCQDGRCVVAAAWGEAHTGCTRSCEADSDCPEIAGCVAGPVCTAIALLGPLCCEKVCACRDELSEAWLSERASDCASDKYCS